MLEYLSLDGSWTLSGPKQIKVEAIVPGCVHADLRRADVIPDPYFRDNEKRVQWVGESDWTYEREFEVSEALLARERISLRCDGLDTFATIYLNGKKLGEGNNMFRRWEFDLKGLLKPGSNKIAIALFSTLPYAEKMQEERFLWLTGLNHHRISGGNWVRKEQSNYGWDWGPMIVTAGIWRSIGIEAFDTAKIEDLRVLQRHGRRSVELEVETQCQAIKRVGLTVKVVVRRSTTVVAEGEAKLVRGKTTVTVKIAQPELWWPRGMGSQPLYDVVATLVDERGEALAEESRRIGLRELKLVRENDQWGQSFHFEANGRAFFAKGANWIPADQFDVWATDQRCRDLLQAAADANMNMIRVWGGGKYERDAFYDACDELGLCVWQDFMFGCSAYPAHDDDFLANVKVEAEQNVRRLRHHASLALWCGNNELEQIKPIIGDQPGQMSWADYKKLFDVLLAKVVLKEDPQTAYWPSSEHSPVGDREDSNNPDCGDAHLWKVWHAREPFEWYRTSFHRFCSEFGFQSFPEPRTIETYTLPEERNVTSYAMEEHQRSPIGNSAIIDYMLSWFRLPVGFENSVWLSQILQGLAIKYAVEHWRRNKPRCMGALYWQLNDCWPVASWSSVDYLLKWKALHYAARDFFAPVLLSGVEDLESSSVEWHVDSELAEPIEAELSWVVSLVDGQVVERGSRALRVRSDSGRVAHRLQLGRQVTEHGRRSLLVTAQLKQGDSLLSENLVTLARPKHLSLEDPKLALKVSSNGDGTFEVRVKALKPALWVWLELPGTDAAYSDNFFHLMSNESAVIRVSPKTKTSIGAIKQILRAKSLYDTYQDRAR